MGLSELTRSRSAASINGIHRADMAVWMICVRGWDLTPISSKSLDDAGCNRIRKPLGSLLPFCKVVKDWRSLMFCKLCKSVMVWTF